MAPAADPAAIQSLMAQGNQDAQMGRVPQAVGAFEQATRLDPGSASAWQRLGLLCSREREFHRGLVALEKAAALDPHDALTARTLGLVALSMSRFDEAARVLRCAAALDPADAEAQGALAEAELRQDPTQAGQVEAEKTAQASLRLRPTSAAYTALSEVAMARHRYPAAIDDLNAALKLDPRRERTYLLLSQCCASAGKPDLARKAVATYLRIRRSPSGASAEGVAAR